MRAALLVFAAAACSPQARSETFQSDSVTLAQREDRFSKVVASPDSAANPGSRDRKPVARWVLPRTLAEISGLALTADGRLLVHDDESARIAEIDYRRGSVVKVFAVGRPAIRGDFEGITTGDGSVFLLASNGIVYEFREGTDGQHVDYRVLDTGLAAECEFEGIAFEPAHTLLLACKAAFRKGLAGSLVLYRVTPGSGSPPERIVLPLEPVLRRTGWKGFSPSDLAIDPVSGHLVLVAAREEGIVELLPNGGLVRAEPLAGRHQHSEGVAVTGHGSGGQLLIVSDESGQRAASITLYRWR